MFKAFITNLAKYNEGTLVGEWVDFPIDGKTLDRVMNRIGGGEYIITDYDIDVSGITEALGEHENLAELNYLAKRLEELDSWEIEVLESVLEWVSYCSSSDLINLTYNLDNFQILPDIDDDEDLGRYYIEESGCYDLSNMGTLANYIDYEAFGRDVRLEEGGGFTSSGYIYDTENTFVDEYDGKNIPEEYQIVDDDEFDLLLEEER